MRNNRSFRMSLAAGLLTAVFFTGTVSAYADEKKAVLDCDSLQTVLEQVHKKDKNVTKIAMSTSAEGHIAEQVGDGVVGYVQDDTFYIAPHDPNETVYAPEDMSYFFSDYDAYAHITSFDLSALDTSDTTNMNHLFASKQKMTEVNLSGWDTSNVTDMSYMFQGTAITETPIEAFDFSSASYIDGMFEECTKLTEIDFSGKSFGNELYSINNLFSKCSSLKTFRFADVSIPGVKSWTNMFAQCDSVETIDFSGTDLSKITDVSNMFYGCQRSSFDLSFFDFSNVEVINGLFSNCSNLSEIDLSDVNFEHVKNAGNLFMSCYNLETMDLSFLEGKPVENIAYMFMNCWRLKSVNLSSLEGAPIKNIGNLFSGCSALTSIDLTPLKNAPITSSSYLFSGCSSLTTINLTPLANAPITSMSGLFSGCSSLTTVDLTPLAKAPITSMDGLFSGCSSLTEVDLNVLENAHPTNLSSLFVNCTKLEKYSIDKLDLSQVVYMGGMFSGTSFTEIDLTGLRLYNVSDIHGLFQECEELTTVKFPHDLMKFDNLSYVFDSCYKLEYVDFGGAIFDVDYNYAGYSDRMFKYCSSLKEVCCQKSMWEKLGEGLSKNSLDTNTVHFHQDADGDGVCDECGYLFGTEKFAEGMSLSLSDLIRFHLYADLSVNPKLAQDPDNYLSFVMVNGDVVKAGFEQAEINTTAEEGKTLYDYSFGLPAFTCGSYKLYAQMKTVDGCYGEFVMINISDSYYSPIISDQSGKYSEKCKTLVEKLQSYGYAANRYFFQQDKRQLANSTLNEIEKYRIENCRAPHTPCVDEHYVGMTLLLDYDLILRVYCNEDFEGSTGTRDSLYFAQYRVAPYQFDVVDPISGQSVNDYIYRILSIPNEGITVEEAYLKEVCYTLHQYGVAAADYYEEEMNK